MEENNCTSERGKREEDEENQEKLSEGRPAILFSEPSVYMDFQ